MDLVGTTGLRELCLRSKTIIRFVFVNGTVVCSRIRRGKVSEDSITRILGSCYNNFMLLLK